MNISTLQQKVAPASEMNLLHLPNEMLMEICTYLNGADRMRLSTVCHRFNALIFQSAWMKRWTLRLNYIDYGYDEYGMAKTSSVFIGEQVLQDTTRRYQSVAIAHSPKLERFDEHHERLLCSRLKLLEAKPHPVQVLYVIDCHSMMLRVLAAQCGTLLAGLVGLSVSVGSVSRRHLRQACELHLPNLRWLEWAEVRYDQHIAQRLHQRIVVRAPMLERAVISALSTQYGSVAYNALRLQECRRLSELNLPLSSDTVDFLSAQPLPTVRQLALFSYLTDIDADWATVANHVPALETLQLSLLSTMTTPLEQLLTRCHMLTELHIEYTNLTPLFARMELWQRVRVLHIHRGLLEVGAGEVLRIELPQVRSFCLSLEGNVQGRVQFHLPNVRTMSLLKLQDRVDILETPLLEWLYIRNLVDPTMTFLNRPLPSLRRFFAQETRMRVAAVGAVQLRAPLESLTVISCYRSTICRFVEDVDRRYPNLRSLQLAGLGTISHLSRKCFRAIFGLPELESVVLNNIRLTKRLTRSVPVPARLKHVAFRTLLTPCNTQFLSVDSERHPNMSISTMRMVQLQFISCNPSLVDRYYNELAYERPCMDKCLQKY